MRTRRRVHDESGFTLAELIVTLVLETVVFGALATAFVVALNGGSSVNESLQKSSDARFAAAYIVSDARNSSGPEISLTDTASCTDPDPPVVGTPTAVARFDWNAPNLAGTTTANISNYVLVSGSLLRRHCEAGVLVGDGVLATSVAGLTVTCSPIADCSGAPVSITVAITETPDTVGGTPYTYSLTAAFRKLIGGGSSLTPSPPQSLVIFGSGGCGIDVSGGSTIGVKVYGKASINAVDSGSCKAINLSGSGRFSAGSTSILQGGSCVASGGSTCPPWTSYPTPIGDPYAGLAAPATTGSPQTNACSGTGGSATAQPGVYSSAFVVAGSVSCTLASGIYVFKAGFSVTAGGSLTTAAGGVLIYLTGGAFNADGAANVTLTAMTTGVYAGLVVWQAAADTTTFNVAAGGVVVFGGGIYVPKAEVLFSGNAQAPRATSVVVQNIVMLGSAGIIIGAVRSAALDHRAGDPGGVDGQPAVSVDHAQRSGRRRQLQLVRDRTTERDGHRRRHRHHLRDADGRCRPRVGRRHLERRARRRPRHAGVLPDDQRGAVDRDDRTSPGREDPRLHDDLDHDRRHERVHLGGERSSGGCDLQPDHRRHLGHADRGGRTARRHNGHRCRGRDRERRV